jgi:serine/threonine-protein kinase
MTPQRQIMSILGEAVEFPSPEERAAFLDTACAGDADRRERVEALLRAYEAAGSFLENSRSRSELGVTDDEPISERPGTVIGPYKLMEQIGEGGMGLVFVAEQQQPIRRKVALKVIKPGMDTRQVVARFEAERQALALMDHPNIAKVLDGGQASSGRPYFVMDLVKGLPIADYCDQAQHTPRERLELFVHLCQAVQHAHQKGIIHRDLKPSNVLVTLHDGTPLVKVIDFGIAKALGQSLTDKTLFTGFAQMVGTPLYMSPEQAALSNADVDTRSDIYSLGVLLYELLTGTTPFDKERLKTLGYDELRRIIREEEPPRPSTRISTLGKAATTLSTQRKSDPRRLSQLCRGELDWIVMKCLEKDRNRRYETASALAADVQRYLHDEPVQACPPSAWYRFRKIARRNRGRLAAAAVLSVALLAVVGVTAGSIGWAAHNREARQARLTGQVEAILEEAARLEQEQKRSEARVALERAEAVAGDEASDALRQRIAGARHDLKFVAELDRIREERAATVEGKFNSAGAAKHYAEVFRDNELDVEALSPEEVAARLQGKPALEMAVAAALDDWVDARRFGEEEDSSWKLLVAVARKLDPDPLRDRLRALWGQPSTPESQADLRQLAESIDVKTQRPATLQTLARTLDRVKLADAALRVLLDGRRAYPGDFWLNYDLGNQFFVRNDYAEMLLYCSAAVSLRPDSSFAHNSLAIALSQERKTDEAAYEYKKAIALDPKNAVAHFNLGLLLFQRRKWDEAVAAHRKAIEIAPKFAIAHYGLGHALYQQKKLDEAVAAYRKAIEIAPKYVMAHTNLAKALHDQGKRDEAIAEYKKVIDLDPNNAIAHGNLGDALRDQGKQDEAIACYQKVAELDPKNSSAHDRLGYALFQQGKQDEAIACYQKVAELDPKNAVAHFNLANTCARLGRWDQALAAMDKAAVLSTNDHQLLYHAAAFHLHTGDLAGYRRICREMLERFGDTKDLWVAEHVAMICLLMPDAVADRERVLKLARWTVPQNSNERWFLLCVALSEYRAGRSAEAVRWLERFAPKAAYGRPSEVSAFAVLALAQHDQGRREDALAALDQAERVATKMPDPAGGRPFGDDWPDWLHGQALLGEAEKVIKPEEARVHLYRGSRRTFQGKRPEAEGEYRQAVRLRPDWYEAHYQLAVAIWEQGRQKDAQAAFRDALRLKPKQADGPPRSTVETPLSDSGQWAVKDQEIHQLDESHGHIALFGDLDWTDYDFEAEVEIIAGGSEVGLIFRATDRTDFLYAVVGAWGNTSHSVLIQNKTDSLGIGFAKGQSKKGCWYRLRVEARRERVKMFLDDKLLMTIDAGERLRGCVGLLSNCAHTRYRNLKVTDATGKMLWEGVEGVLPKK